MIELLLGGITVLVIFAGFTWLEIQEIKQNDSIVSS